MEKGLGHFPSNHSHGKRHSVACTALHQRGNLKKGRNFLGLFSLGGMKANNQTKQRARYDDVADDSDNHQCLSRTHHHVIS
jgi:hypothetical protein